MEKGTVTKFRWFWAWQDESEEKWLGKMSQQGYHLSSVSLPGFYTFSVAEPRNYVYRLDYQMFRKQDKQEYLQIFEDAGWEHIGEMSAWQYFRKEDESDYTAEIFTDVESKIAKYKRVLTYIMFFLIIEAIFVVVFADNVWGQHPYSWWGIIQAILIFVTLVMLLLFYAGVKLILRIRKLRKL